MVVLLTDFGQSEYVGVMKAVLYSVNSDAKIVDLCHSIKPQSIIEASWILKNNYKYFPEGAVFCCVVDPGVGTDRRAIAVQTDKYYFVGPDNGLLWETLAEQEIIQTRQIPVPPEASRTFHGRDVFAKAAAAIDMGEFRQIGLKVENIKKMQLYQNGREGIVVRIDRFGNIVTNISRQAEDNYTVAIGEKQYFMVCQPNYESAKEGGLFLIEGSSRTLEISLKNGNANDKLHLKTADMLKILPRAWPGG
ncbi:S-adenosyl-l-methionine hydroxide adenosyltransferase family protein [Planctomycetota bacterium]